MRVAVAVGVGRAGVAAVAQAVDVGVRLIAYAWDARLSGAAGERRAVVQEVGHTITFAVRVWRGEIEAVLPDPLAGPCVDLGGSL